MSSDGLNPDLSSIANDYEIISDLRESASARSYLARHRKLNRDVTVTVSVPAKSRNALEHFASDARMLSVMRHRNVVPVIEGRWIPSGGFAVARARVRGTTLEESIREDGALPGPRVGDILEQVKAALEWARDNGIMNRGITASSIVLQQGSGRVMIELDPSPASGMPDACDDAHTIGQLAFEMLSGQLGVDANRALGEARPDLSPSVVRETKALMRCNHVDGPRDAAVLIALLRSRSRSSAPHLPYDPDGVEIPVTRVNSPTAVVKRRSTKSKLVFGIAAFLVVSALGFEVLRRQQIEIVPQVSRALATMAAASGDVALPFRSAAAKLGGSTKTSVAPPRPSTPRTTPASSTTPATSATTPAEAPVTTPASSPKAKPSAVAGDTSRRERAKTTTPQTRREETSHVAAPPPSRAAPPPASMPGTISLIPPVRRNTGGARDTTTTLVAFDSCDSVDPADQQRCLITEVEKNDQKLNTTYERLIGAMRQRASTQANDPDPSSVDSLRRAQQRWQEARESACRGVGSGTMYARVRAQCYADMGAKRTSDLSSHFAPPSGAAKDSARP